MCTSLLWRLAVPDGARVPKSCTGLHNGAFIRTELHKDQLLYYAKAISFSNSLDIDVVLEGLQQVPCGQCEECRIKRSKEWAQRIILESQDYKDNWFLTLTYDDEHLIDNVHWSISRQDGELGYVSFLNKDDFTLFKKRLLERMRDKYNHTGIRFFQCGEYGSKNGRPHFHAIFFNLPIPDLELVKSVSLGGLNYCYYRSKLIEECWGKGFVMIGDVSWESASYVARYVVKKFNSSESNLYSQMCDSSEVPQQPAEFINMSRKPGIARRYYDVNKEEFYKNDNIVLPNGRSVQPCKYFDKLFDIESPEELSDIKSERKRLAQLKEVNQFKGCSHDEVTSIKKKLAERSARARKKLVRQL